jgi:hypothetical protein
VQVCHLAGAPNVGVATGCITEKQEVRCCRDYSGASCFDNLFCGWFGDAVEAPFDGHASRNKSGGLVFITVNQVLVRLWARCGRKSDRMWFVLRDGSSRDRGLCVQRRVLYAAGRPLPLTLDRGDGHRWC